MNHFKDPQHDKRNCLSPWKFFFDFVNKDTTVHYRENGDGQLKESLFKYN